jgi:hypothetical protein
VAADTDWPIGMRNGGHFWLTFAAQWPRSRLRARAHARGPGH